MNLKLLTMTLIINLVISSIAGAQFAFSPITVGSKLKFSLKLPSAEDKKLQTRTYLAIVDGETKTGDFYTPKAGDTFCWVNRNYLMEVSTQDEVILEVEKMIGTRAILMLESSPDQRVTLSCAVKSNAGPAFSVLITPENLQNITNGLITVVP